jgi:hypothetical protein
MVLVARAPGAAPCRRSALTGFDSGRRRPHRRAALLSFPDISPMLFVTHV